MARELEVKEIRARGPDKKLLRLACNQWVPSIGTECLGEVTSIGPGKYRCSRCGAINTRKPKARRSRVRGYQGRRR